MGHKTGTPLAAVSTALPSAAFTRLSRSQWAQLGSEGCLREEQDRTDLDVRDGTSACEVEEVFLPLAHLIEIRLQGARRISRREDEFLGRPRAPLPFVVGVSGGVAVGKSTFAKSLQEVLQRGPRQRQVELVTTDGFLRPNAWLEHHGMLARKGFPETYDDEAFERFLMELKEGAREVSAPLYCHDVQDVLPHRRTIGRPEILLLEGLNVLQTPPCAARRPASDFIDFSLYLDADATHIEGWYLDRILPKLQTRKSALPRYFENASEADPDEFARRVWREINLPNLAHHILPTRDRADAILRKGLDHAVGEIWLRRR